MEADDPTPINVDVLMLPGLSALTMADMGSAIDRCERLAHDLQQSSDRLDDTVRNEAANIDAEIEAFLRDRPDA